MPCIYGPGADRRLSTDPARFGLGGPQVQERPLGRVSRFIRTGWVLFTDRGRHVVGSPGAFLAIPRPSIGREPLPELARLGSATLKARPELSPFTETPVPA
jgi:hypothetical protein